MIEIGSYLIHSKVTAHRLENSLKALQKFSLYPTIITTFDADEINNNSFPELKYQEWENKRDIILPILLDNLNSATSSSLIRQKSEYVKYAKLILADFPTKFPQWLCPRSLTKGEKSVLLKHNSAITMIANSKLDYGMVFEDDIIASDEHSLQNFETLIRELKAIKSDYVDLAGGCNLHASEMIPKSQNNLVYINPPRTRTNAAYLLSKSLAKILANKFMPVVLPIDWHLSYLLYSQITKGYKCYWCEHPPFLHGSEMGAYKSWRE